MDVDGWYPNVTSPNLGLWAMLQTDGGFAFGFLDAGSPAGGGTWNHVRLVGPGPELAVEVRAWDGTGTTFVFARDSVSSQPLPALAGNSCDLATAQPRTWACFNGLSEWRDEWGALLAPPSSAGLPLGERSGNFPRAVFGFELLPDGGADTEHLVVSAVRDGGAFPYATFHEFPAASSFFVHELGGRLQLFTYGHTITGGICPTCALDRFVAEYVCAPP